MHKNALPRWRGFNLLYFFHTRSDGAPVEDDFRWIADWGFDFVRLPMCYTLWTQEGDPLRVNESMLERIDEAVKLGRRHGLHVSLNFHRAPGYSVNRERQEPFNLWKDPEALDAFCFQWDLFTRRYRGVPSGDLSFDLVNEPPRPAEGGIMTRSDHERIVRAAVAVIRKADAERPIMVDGLSWGNDPLPELADLSVGQSCRGYLPMEISHHRASWVDDGGFPDPVWPGVIHGEEPWDRLRLQRHYAAWAELLGQGVGVHCGERVLQPDAL